MVLGFASLLNRCEFLNPDLTRTDLAADYSVVTDYEGYSCLHFQKHFWADDVALMQLDSAAVIRSYVATCMSEAGDGGQFYFLPLNPSTEETIKVSTIGPLTRAAYRLKLYELAGDSTLRLHRVQ